MVQWETALIGRCWYETLLLECSHVMFTLKRSKMQDTLYFGRPQERLMALDEAGWKMMMTDTYPVDDNFYLNESDFCDWTGFNLISQYRTNLTNAVWRCQNIRGERMVSYQRNDCWHQWLKLWVDDFLFMLNIAELWMVASPVAQ